MQIAPKNNNNYKNRQRMQAKISKHSSLLRQTQQEQTLKAIVDFILCFLCIFTRVWRRDKHTQPRRGDKGLLSLAPVPCAPGLGDSPPVGRALAYISVISLSSSLRLDYRGFYCVFLSLSVYSCSRCFCPRFEPHLTSLFFDCSPPCFSRTTSLSLPFWCPIQRSSW